jgi:hypothetical protein
VGKKQVDPLGAGGPGGGDHAELAQPGRVQAGLLGQFAPGGLLRGLARVEQAAGQVGDRAGQVVVLGHQGDAAAVNGEDPHRVRRHHVRVVGGDAVGSHGLIDRQPDAASRTALEQRPGLQLPPRGDVALHGHGL